MPKSIGTFQVKSSRLLAIDPCYDEDFQGAEISRPLKGTWSASVTRKEGRVATLLAEAVGGKPETGWIEVGGEVGVDAGQAGIFDMGGWRQDKEALVDAESLKVAKDHPDFEPTKWCKENKGKGERFYAACCLRTLGPKACGVIGVGAVSESGWGDGCYTAYVRRNAKGLAVAVKIRFL